MLYEQLQNPQGVVPFTLYCYVGAMILLSLCSVFFQIKAREENGTLNAFFSILGAGTGPTYQEAEDDIDTDKEE